MKKRYDNLLDELVDKGIIRSPLPSEMIHQLRDRKCTADRDERKRRMIEHGDVDPDYFNR